MEPTVPSRCAGDSEPERNADRKVDSHQVSACCDDGRPQESTQRVDDDQSGLFVRGSAEHPQVGSHRGDDALDRTESTCPHSDANVDVVAFGSDLDHRLAESHERLCKRWPSGGPAAPHQPDAATGRGAGEYNGSERTHAAPPAALVR